MLLPIAATDRLAIEEGRTMTMPVAPERVELTVMRPVRRTSYAARALSIWPRLDAARLRRTKGDPYRIARLVQSRTMLSIDEILGILGVPAAD